MKQEKITLSKSGIITLPGNLTETVWMRDFDIAELFGVIISTIKYNIRAVLKSGVMKADLQHGEIVHGKYILPNYFGLDMITTLAFRINSLNAKLFREYIFGKPYAVNTQSTPNIIIQVNANKRLNKEKVILN